MSPILVCLLLLTAAVWAEGNSSPATTAPTVLPKAKVDAVEEEIHGHKIADPYRSLENGDSPATQHAAASQCITGVVL